ncbi:heavy-metal-associated domain-containing protein [Sphingomonas sp. 28-62-11]|uniref:heavy-metal-associated domain-containing protein n=1 Tax=Sphingomonas sp. 28-62-11 TaxID=1970432 RepID=UPI000BDC5DE7|nr:MAG: hypothetical protein B7Y49_00655 [Sphingomonas sp. 28-62-11]
MAINRPRFVPTTLAIAALLVAGLINGSSVAQGDAGQRRSSPGGSGSFEVGGVEVDTSGKTANAARLAGWRLAQRKGWQMLSRRMGGGGGNLSDSALDSIVSGIVVENEQIGPNRYVARLGVMFDRNRAASILGVAGSLSRSPPMLVLPVEWSGGAARVFEQRTDWHEAWARFRTGNSTIDYVRPSGTGPDSLLLNAGQINRPSRGWWRMVLEQYGASDVLIPIVHLFRQYPGGPIVGQFQARFGPDNRLLTRFSLRVGSGDALPALLDAGIKRIDQAYQNALSAGVLRVDPGLRFRPPGLDEEDEATVDESVAGDEAVIVDGGAGAISVQFDTPGSAAVEATERALRGIPGVRSAITTSLALGGISVMRVGYDGDVAALKAALEARGWQVTLGSGAIRIQRARTPSPQPVGQAENATAG